MDDTSTGGRIVLVIAQRRCGRRPGTLELAWGEHAKAKESFAEAFQSVQGKKQKDGLCSGALCGLNRLVTDRSWGK